MTKLYFGLFNLPWWGYLLVVLALTHITIVAVTLFLHRAQSHRALDLHPLTSHFFRFWLWLTTGMRTKEWVAIHRKHHASSDKVGDPHSPVIFGLREVLWRGTELYRDASLDTDILQRYGHGTPDDWIERHVYWPHNYVGIVIMLAIDLVCFGLPGISIWGMQMIWIPFFAAGIINGVGHYFGYRNFECADHARNMLPWGILIGGEELHNNHHTYPTSAKLSARWFEFDLCWLYIRVLRFFKLVQVRKTLPKELLQAPISIDFINIETIKSVLRNRFTIVANYNKTVLLPLLKKEKQTRIHNKPQRQLLARAKQVLVRDPKLLKAAASTRLHAILARFDALRTAYQFRLHLQQLWMQHSATHKELIESLQNWCREAEASGIRALEDFSQYLRRQTLPEIVAKNSST